MIVIKNYVKNIQFIKRKYQILNYLSSILNVINFYQLPLLKYICLSFKLVSKDRFIILSYYVLFKYFFNIAPKIYLIKKKQTGLVVPTELRVILYRRNITTFFNHFFFRYKKEGVEEKRTFVSSPSYKGNECSLVLNNFFVLSVFLDMLLLYKNDGLFLGTYEKVYCKFIFLSKVNLWNHFYLNFLLNPEDNTK